MLYVFVPFFVAMLVTLVVVHSSRSHGHLSADHDLSGPQKFHARPVPRIGGVGIFVGVLVCAGLLLWRHHPHAQIGLMLLACSVPAFAAGLIEDFTKRVSPGKRLLATAVSALLAAWWMGALITRTDIPGMDWVVGTTLGATLITVFVVSGVANSINIIDGFNGLSSMCVCLMLLAMAYVAFVVGDTALALWALIAVGAVLGFFVWNFPGGMIFLGDGGAYFLGFFLGEIGVLLLSRNPEVSPLFPLMVCIYPVFETMFSIYRRRYIRSAPPGEPDGIHLHSLIYRRLMRWAIGAQDARLLTRRNSMTAPYLWTLCGSSLLPALLFWDSTPWLAACLLVFGVTYVRLYWRIVRFRTPQWMVFRQRAEQQREHQHH
ncbi:glycosyltransferase [Roseateles sp. BYS180W]|uniref:Glycosyltransferase n=1 Tax=Roseateles rivi TaxID=3299028 RepID=A0ABW7FSB7_9BURK